jgi:hypothetical protein
MLKTITLILSILLLTTQFSMAQSSTEQGWRLIYENDANGTALSGSKQQLVKSIEEGKSIRVSFCMGNSTCTDVYALHTALVKFTTILNSPNGQFVAAQIDPIIGQIPDLKTGRVLLKENQEWSLIVTSLGEHDQMTRNMITGEIIDHRLVRWGIKWFVN